MSDQYLTPKEAGHVVRLLAILNREHEGAELAFEVNCTDANGESVGVIQHGPNSGSGYVFYAHPNAPSS